MKIVDDPLRRKYSGRGRCQFCGQWSEARHCHHIFARGPSSCRQLDVPENLIALCPQCHAEVHAANILREDLLAVVAARLGTQQHLIEEKIWKFRQQ